jgi:hypothetical protein
LATGIGSHEAFAESIPFRLDNKNLTEARCISCSGPWSRTTNWNKVDADTNREFYHATANLFTPFGQWSCHVAALNEGGCNFQFIDPVPTIASRLFCLPNPPVTPSVQLTLTQEPRRLTANYANDCDNSAATSFLGDNPQAARVSRSRRAKAFDFDQDSFGVTAEAGDELQIRFAGHEDGYQDGEAVLSLLDENDAVVERVDGTPPLDIATVAPQGGDYRIVVQQADADETTSAPFRGAYRLGLVTSGAPPLLTPDLDVEP